MCVSKLETIWLYDFFARINHKITCMNFIHANKQKDQFTQAQQPTMKLLCNFDLF